MLQAYVSCGEDAFSTTLSAIRGGLNGPDRTPMVQLLTAMAAAFDRIGWPICFTVATEDLSTGNLSNEVEDPTVHFATGSVAADTSKIQPFNDVVRAQRWAANTAKAFDDAGFPICLTVATADRSTNKLLDQSFFYTGGP
eukprot:scaffold13.g279.t1